MEKNFSNVSFRSKILIILLLNTILLSGFSLIFVQSIEEINQVSIKIKDRNIPEFMWISHWKEELSIKKYMIESYDSNNFGQEFIETYKSLEPDDFHSMQAKKPPVPKSLEPFKRKMDLLDFAVMNNVQGLIQYGDKEGAKNYIAEKYIPELEVLQQELRDLENETFLSINDHSNQFSSIIKKSLSLLFLMTFGVICLSIYASYRISGSLTKPIEGMVDKVDDIANGQYGLVISETSQIELQHLTHSINQMSLRLKESFSTILADKMYREQILNSLPVGIITIDDYTSAFSFNTAAKNLLHMNDEKLRALIENKGGAPNQSFWDILLSKEICQNVKVLLKIDQENRHLLVSQSELFNQQKEVIGRIFYFIDITKTEELENKMHQSEKLALVGELAAGAAHEIRNPLAVIHGFLSLMNQSISDAEKERFYLPLVMKEIERINSIIEEMLLLSKPGAPISQKVYIEDIVKDILPLITQTSPSRQEKQIEFLVDLEKVPVFVDANQMKQVLHNLIRNSMEAIAVQGHISIYSSVKDDMYQIYIKDTGTGIPSDMQSSLYHPFSTSKETGTGLGLTIVQRILQNHEGKIELVSTSSEGTTFLIHLPLRV
ncbi:sensor histidine kinase [Priestia abyssalis]|uniref:sensor histidine kinase n=1 Tax=Priestia abyssalis TaxID=1221450 RepID=UPI000995D810|nr:ATP-binding protein [Priestia abyssalis]